MALSVGLLVAVVNVPLHKPMERVGWTLGQHSQDEVINLMDVEQRSENGSVAVVGMRSSEPEPEPEPEEQIVELEPPGPEPEEESFEPDPMLKMVYEDVEDMPEVEGGITSYYLNIEYPRAALIAGIQGSLLLTFIVEPSGRATNIEVVESLHPLCDSAAVRALRRTRFVPGKQQGERVPVRMRLPVRFQIVDQPVATSDMQDL